MSTLKKLSALLPLFMPAILFAQEKAAAPKAAPSNNELLYLLGIIMLVLVLVIWGLGQITTTLGRQLVEKDRNKILGILLLPGLLLISSMATAQNDTTQAVTTTTIGYGSLGSTGFWLIMTVILVEMITILFLLFSIRRLQAELMPESKRKKQFDLKATWAKLDSKLFTKAVSIEKEKDVLLDHDYDGIKELDNALPPWWKYGFIFTVVVGFIYLLNFHVLGIGLDPEQEYQQELVMAKKAKEKYDAMNADKIDENNIQMPDAAGIAAGKEIYTATCWPCHGKLGEGGAGPNLTDDHWIHKGSLSDIYTSIKTGYPDKGMQGWEKNYSAKDINNLAGFIRSIRGTNPPNAKAAQGDLYTEAPVADSVNVAVKDSVKTK
jgi:cytochrome c oxidase cbb3-type subunit III